MNGLGVGMMFGCMRTCYSASIPLLALVVGTSDAVRALQCM